ncbi:hypothetical protein BB560_003899 [Smittium megazygosporum]|uniref:Major facilitator superfamily (MFS) profile domain-containing protein n=1 Tax=Smittium megazygosporum TaxID=133381 RepID=A0A2T9ZAR7_9FUNG|nr:hypothetical protein BB560_003899 [Smittium megazygosporum]
MSGKLSLGSNKDEAEATNSNNSVPEEPLQDQGYAWVIFAAGFMIFLITFGAFNAFGVFQTYYLLTIFKDVPADLVGWISTVTIVMTHLGGLTAGMFVRAIGVRKTCLLFSITGCLGLILSSFFQKVWHLVLTQGLLYGFSCSILINVSITMQSMWFNKYKGFVLGSVSAAGGIGSLIMVPTVTSSIKSLDVRWSFRILAIVFAVTTIPGSLLLKPRVPFIPSKKIIDLSLFKDPYTIFLFIACFGMQWGYTVSILFFPASLKDLGKSQTFATNYIMAFSSASIVGRVCSGLLADTFDPIYVLITSMGGTMISVFVLWLGIKTVPSFLAFYILYGLFGINLFSLSPMMVGRHYQLERVSQANALMFMSMGIASLLGIPISSYVFQHTGHRTNFNQIIILCGSFYALGFIDLIAFKFYTSYSKNKGSASL